MNWTQYKVPKRIKIQTCVCFSRLSSLAAPCRSAQNCETDSFLVTDKSRCVQIGILNIKRTHLWHVQNHVYMCVCTLSFSVYMCVTLFQRHHTLLSLPQRQSPNFSIACSKRKRREVGTSELQKEKPDAIGPLRVTGVIVMCQSA